jgi:hypothetical protein
VRAHLLQARRPVDVGLLVEARHQLHHHRHFLARARRVDERLHDHRVDAGAVHGLLDGDHVGVARRLADELDHRRERLERPVHHHVALADGLEEVAPLGDALRQPLLERRVLEVGPVHLFDHAHQPREVHGSRDHVEVVALEAELAEEEARHRLRHVVGDFQAHGVAEVALRQLALERLAQVLHLLLLDEEVGVARDAELVAAEHVHAREELAHVLVQDRGEEDEVGGAVRHVLGQAYHSRQHARGLHDRRARVAPEGVAPLELDGEVEALVEDPREGMRGVEPDGCQDRHRLAEEVVADPLLLARGPLGAAQEPDALLGERRQDVLVEEAVLALDDALRARRDLAKDLDRREPVGPGGAGGGAKLDLFLYAGKPDLEEPRRGWMRRC